MVKIDPNVAATHAVFGGDLVEMQRQYDLAGELEMVAAERDRLIARVDELEEALKPFTFGETTMEVLYDGMPDDKTGTITAKLGDFRRASRAIYRPSPEGEANG